MVIYYYDWRTAQKFFDEKTFSESWYRMNKDIFDTLDKAGFGSNVHEVAAEGECRVLRLDDESVRVL